MNWFFRFIVNAIVLYLIAKYVPGFNHNAGVWTAIVAAIVFGVVNAILGPILRLLTFPLTVVTFGLFSIVVNYILFVITVWVTPGLHTTGAINPWLANLYGAIIMMIVSTIMHQGTRPETPAAS